MTKISFNLCCTLLCCRLSSRYSRQSSSSGKAIYFLFAICLLMQLSWVWANRGGNLPPATFRIQSVWMNGATLLICHSDRRKRSGGIYPSCKNYQRKVKLATWENPSAPFHFGRDDMSGGGSGCPHGLYLQRFMVVLCAANQNLLIAGGNHPWFHRWITAATLRGSIQLYRLYLHRFRNGTQAVPYSFAGRFPHLTRVKKPCSAGIVFNPSYPLQNPRNSRYTLA